MRDFREPRHQGTFLLLGSSHDFGVFFGKGTDAASLGEASLTTPADPGYHVQSPHMDLRDDWTALRLEKLVEGSSDNLAVERLRRPTRSL